MFSSDILYLLFEVSDVRTILNIGATSKENYAQCVDFRSRLRRAGNTILYRRQAESIDYIKQKFAEGEKQVLLNAPMSFGKTLVGIEIALSFVSTGAVYFVIPPTIETAIKKEFTKFYPRMMKKCKMEDRSVYFSTGKQAAQRKYLEKLGAMPSLLKGKIVVTTDLSHIVSAAASLIIKDECHLNADNFAAFMNCHQNIPFLLMGASETSIRAERVNMNDVYLATPTAFDNIVKIHPTATNIVNIVMESKAKHIIVALPNSDKIDEITRKIKAVSTSGVYDYTNKSIRMLDAFTKNGGILLTTIRTIAEGNNFNTCSNLIISLPSTNHSAEGLISLRRIQQVRGRVCRQSSNHSSVTITYISDNTVMLARAMLAPAQIIGYEILERRNMTAIVDALLPKYKNISTAELVALIAIPNCDEYACKSGPPTLTMSEFLNILDA